METITHVSYFRKYALLFIFLCLASIGVKGQEINLSLNSSFNNLPPLDVSYVRKGNQMFVTLVLNDFSFKQYSARLELIIKGNGIELKSSLFSNYETYTLIPGIPKVISSYDLADYFDVSNLDFSGLDKNTYLENGALPEGTYDLCFTAIDAYSDGNDPLSNTECDRLNLRYSDPPVITSTVNDILDRPILKWNSKVNYAGEVDHVIEAYLFKGGSARDIRLYQNPVFTLRSDNNEINISEEIGKMSSKDIYVFFVKAKSKVGFQHTFKNKGYSEPLFFQALSRSADCDGVIQFEEIMGVDGKTYLYAYVEGCDQMLGAFQPIGSSGTINLTNLIEYDITGNTGYTANIICLQDPPPPCTYTETYGNPDCIINTSCTTVDGCQGYLGSNCECIQKCVTIQMRESTNAQGETVISPNLPEDCDNPTFLWSSGETAASIIANSNAGYSVEVICETDGCTFCASFNERSGCWPGRLCSDGNPCTINDVIDENCNCVGTSVDCIDGENPNCTDQLSFISVEDPSGGILVVPQIDCDVVQYLWNDDYDQNASAYYSPTGGGEVFLTVFCSNGCSYTNSINLNDCTPGTPCQDDGDLTTIELFDEQCQCITYDCPDVDGDGIPDKCDEDQSCPGSVDIIYIAQSNSLAIQTNGLACMDYSVLWSNGATTNSISYVNPTATYTVILTCVDGCSYSAKFVSTDEDCIPSTACFDMSLCNGIGEYDENCDCVEVVPDYTFNALYEINTGQLFLEINVDDQECTSPSYEWNTGASSASILITNFTATYICTVTCGYGCDFIASHTFTTGDCIVNLPCNDGNPCTNFDTIDEDCNCIGSYELDSDNIPITEGCTEDPCNNYIPCDDGNPCTFFDYLICGQEQSEGDEDENDNEDYPCQGIFLNDENGYPITECGDDDSCVIGFPCNDNNPCTINEVYDENCTCVGEPLLDSNGNPQTDCDETNPCDEIVGIQVGSTISYDELILTAVSSCDDIDSYLWNTGSTAASIVVSSQSGNYSVIITCGECQYLATYSTDGCIVGLPCNDGLDCTVNDMILENCECEGSPLEDLSITFSEETLFEELCDYCLPIHGSSIIDLIYIKSVKIQLPDLTIMELDGNLNSEGFDFPYCFSPGVQVSCPNASGIFDLVNDLNQWFAVTPGIDGTATMAVQNEVLCPNSPFVVVQTNVTFLSINTYNDIESNIIYGFNQFKPCSIGSEIGKEITPLLDCGIGSVLWSTGATSNSLFIEEGMCVDVEVTCENGCTYYGSYGTDCGCVVGSPCDLGPCYLNPTYDANCNCVGELLPDSDEDGICDDLDECPGETDEDINQNGIADCNEVIDPDECEILLDLGYNLVEIEKDPCTYCLLVEDVFFETNNNIQLVSVSIQGEMPIILDSNTPGMSFPYDVNKFEYPGIIIDDFYNECDLTPFNYSDNKDSPCGDGIEKKTYLFSEDLLDYKVNSFTFSFGSGELYVKDFTVINPCSFGEANYLLSVTHSDCNDPTYLWSDGSTSQSIEILSTTPEYQVTVTCGQCMDDLEINIDGEENCTVGSACENSVDLDCYEVEGYYDAYCNCILIPLTSNQSDIDEDGVPDCKDECPEIPNTQDVDGDGILDCCITFPSFAYTENLVNVTDYCIKLNNVENEKLYKVGIENGEIILDSSTPGFNFPYCFLDNCKDPNSINYSPNFNQFLQDLVKWSGNEFRAIFAEDNPHCGSSGYSLFIDGSKTEFSYLEFTNGKIDFGILEQWGVTNQEVESYTVSILDYFGCNPTKIEWSDGEGDPYDVIANSFRNGLPNENVGFRVTVTCESGCEYILETTETGCIVGDPCYTASSCADSGIIGYDSQNGCICIPVGLNDSDDDSVCDDEDICDGEDDTIDNNNNGIPDCSESCLDTAIVNFLRLTNNIWENCQNDMSIAEITIISANGNEIVLDKNSPGFNFPYCTFYCSSGYPDIVNFQSDFNAFANQDYILDIISNEDLINIITTPDIPFEFSKMLLVCESGFTQVGGFIQYEIEIPSPCDDGWECTINDHYDENCNCVGTFVDTDGDFICDENDDCPGFPDQFDMDDDGIADGCDDDNVFICDGEAYDDYCKFLEKRSECVLRVEQGGLTGKIMFNDLASLQKELIEKFISTGSWNASLFPYPELIEQLMNPSQYDSSDGDGIVDFLDPCPNTKAIGDNYFEVLNGTHTMEQVLECCSDWSTLKISLLHQVLFSDITKVELPIFNFTYSAYSECINELNGSEIEVAMCNGKPCDEDEFGNVFDNISGCYIYFDISCSCDCKVRYKSDLDLDGNCNEDEEVLGEPCTLDCDDGNPCTNDFTIANVLYDPVDNPNVPPCLCQHVDMADSDGDGYCDKIDLCAPSVDSNGDYILDPNAIGYTPYYFDGDDGDGDGIPDCVDKCPDKSPAELAELTLDGFGPPTGPGDMCDDGNPCTYDDIINFDCECKGVYLDTDGDSVYDCEGCLVTDEDGNYDCNTCEPIIAGQDADGIDIIWTGCDVCPGLDDTQDFDGDGIPDCIDAPYYPIPCPLSYEIIDGVGIVLVFPGDEIDVEDIPNPISIQGINTSNIPSTLFAEDYLTLSYTREIDPESDEPKTEAIYEFDFDGDIIQNISVIFADHQVCTFGDNSDIIPVPCPTNISVTSTYIQITFENDFGAEFDYSELIGSITFSPSGYNDVNGDISAENVVLIGNEAIVKIEIPSGWGANPFIGDITLPNGQTCNYDADGITSPCLNGLLPGTPCDDFKECTHHDKIVIEDGECICKGEASPDIDSDFLCDAIDPCPEEFNPDNDGDGIGDMEACPCPEMELDLSIEENPKVVNGNDVEIYLVNDISQFASVICTIDDMQNETIELELGSASPLVIPNLIEGYSYYITITGICIQQVDDPSTPEDETISSESSLTLEIYIPFSDNPILCAEKLQFTDIDSYILLPSMTKGEEFSASDFTITTRSIKGQYGKFSGKGYVSVPYFNFVRLNVKFNNITISAGRQMIDGLIEFTGIGLAILGDDISDAINDEINNILNTLTDISDVLDAIGGVLKELEDFYDSIKDLVTEENRACYEAAMSVLNDLIEEAVLGNPNITVEQIKDAMQDVKDCLALATQDANNGVTGLKALLQYSFEQINAQCTDEDRSDAYLDEVSFKHENSVDLVENMFNEFSALQGTGSESGLSLSDLGILKFSQYTEAGNDIIANNIPNGAEIVQHYDLERNYFLCHAAQKFTEEGALTLSNSDATLNDILLAMVASGAEFTAIFGEDISNGLSASQIYAKEGNEDIIREVLSKALSFQVYNNK